MSTIPGGARLVIDADNRAALIVIVTAVGLAWTLLTLIIRIVSRLHVRTNLGFEESLVIAASITAAISSACVLVCIPYGLGHKDSGIVNEKNKLGLKLLWISDIFYLITLGIAKSAALPLLKHLTRIRKFILASYALALITILWAFLSILMVAARCHLEAPWSDVSSKTCPSLYWRWVAIETASLLIEILIFGLFTSIIYILKMRTIVKLKVIIAFTSRLPVIAPTILRLFYLQYGLRVSNDTVFALTDAIITTQVVLHFTTIAASFAYLKPFLRAFDSNLGATVNVDTIVSSGYLIDAPSESERRGSKEKDGIQTMSYPLRSLSRNSKLLSPLNEEHILHHNSLDPNGEQGLKHQTTIDPERPESKASTSVQFSNDPRTLDKKYTSRESMMPMITKTQEWHIGTETRNQKSYSKKV